MIASLPTLVLIIFQPHLTHGAHLHGIRTGLGADDDSHRSALFLNRIGQCKGLEKLPIFVPDARIVQLNTTHYVVSGIIRFHEAYSEGVGISGLVWIEQCSELGTCQPFTSKVAFGDVCQVLNSMDDVFNTFLNRSSPVFKCPFRKGVYRFNDVVMDNEVFR